MATSPNYAASFQVGLQTIADTDTTTLKDLLVGGTGGSKVFAPNVCSNDSAAKVVDLWYWRSSVAYLLGSVSVPAGSGLNNVPPVNLFANIPGLPIDNDGNRYIPLKDNNDKLQVSVEATLTAGKLVTIFCPYENL